MSDFREKTMRQAMGVVAMVECLACRTAHRVDADTYTVFWGDIGVGPDKKIVSGNIDEKGKVTGACIYCRKKECLDVLSAAILK